jgi:hypothetical protein
MFCYFIFLTVSLWNHKKENSGGFFDEYGLPFPGESVMVQNFTNEIITGLIINFKKF